MLQNIRSTSTHVAASALTPSGAPSMEGTESVNGVVKEAGRWVVGASVGVAINSGCYQWKRAHSLPIVFRFRCCFPSLSPSRFAILTSLFCMAANSKGRAIAGSFGKRFVNQIWASRNPAPIAAASDSRRGVHASSYDKNVEEDLVHPVVVPDHVIETSESEKYWGPHPTTGVFGPAATAGTKDGLDNAGDGGGSTVLDQEVWFRPHEDVDKPPHQPGLN